MKESEIQVRDHELINLIIEGKIKQLACIRANFMNDRIGGTFDKDVGPRHTVGKKYRVFPKQLYKAMNVVGWTAFITDNFNQEHDLIDGCGICLWFETDSAIRKMKLKKITNGI